MTRSVLVLKLMAYSPSGAIIAAPTTSLPGNVAGTNNWDYCYCWLRDASMTLRALLDTGYEDEGGAFLRWLLHATRLTLPALCVVYDVYGDADIPERELNHLEGYRGSRPVRIGNSAHRQRQLDLYGEIIAAAHAFIESGQSVDRSEKKLLRKLGDHILEVWQEPDNGIWEARGSPVQHTLAKAMCWIGLDRLIDLHHAGNVDVDVRRLQAGQETIRAAVDRHGWNEEIGSYVAVFDTDIVDSSLLLLGIYGYENPCTPRMRGTTARVRDQLMRNGLLYRHQRSDLPSDQGAFGICGFWNVQVLAREGRHLEACEHFEHLISFANDVGLMAEQIDPRTGETIGNFPQAYTHIGLVNAAVTLQRAAQRLGARDGPASSSAA